MILRRGLRPCRCGRICCGPRYGTGRADGGRTAPFALNAHGSRCLSPCLAARPAAAGGPCAGSFCGCGWVPHHWLSGLRRRCAPGSGPWGESRAPLSMVPMAQRPGFAFHCVNSRGLSAARLSLASVAKALSVRPSSINLKETQHADRKGKADAGIPRNVHDP